MPGGGGEGGGGEEEEEEEVVDVVDEGELVEMLERAAGGPLQATRSILDGGDGALVAGVDVRGELLAHGAAVLAGAVQPSALASAAQQARAMLANNQGLASPVLASDDASAHRYRTDRIAWLSRADETTHSDLAAACETLHLLGDSVIRATGARLRGKREVQLAVYPEGALYERHRDALPLGVDDDIGVGENGELATQARRLTIVLYLTSAESDDDGALRLYLPDGTTRDVAPRTGSAVVFLSGAIDHEVRRCTGMPRAALTLWLS